MVMSYAEARKYESRLREVFGEEAVRAEVTGGLPEDPESFDLDEAREAWSEKHEDDYQGPEPHGDPWIRVDPDRLHDVVAHLKDGLEDGPAFDSLHCLGGDHLPEREELVVIYHLYSLEDNAWIVLKVYLPEEEPIVASITDLYNAADWHEREAFDLLGIRFTDHPDLRRLLLPEDWDGHPLRKDYVFPQTYRGLPVDWAEARENRTSRDEFYDEAEELEEMDIDDELGFPAGNGT